MTYNEWRDELKNNLLSVSEEERRRVLDYYAEAYADRREAGFSEREVIDGFGAPYDAAQRILYEDDDVAFEPRRVPRYEDRRVERNNLSSADHYEGRDRYKEGYNEVHGSSSREDYNAQQYQQQSPAQSNTEVKTAKKGENYSWLFVLLCIIFAIPLFIVVMAMVGITIGLCVAPFSLFGSGIARVFAGIGAAITSPAGGFVQIGLGLMMVGIGLALIPLCIWLVKLMWRLFKKFFAWVKGLFNGKEGV